MNQTRHTTLAHKRERFQQGSLKLEKRKTGPSVWTFRWREDLGHGSFTRRKRVIGTQDEFRNRSAAEKAIAAFRTDLNAVNSVKPMTMTLAEVVDHFKLVELNSTTRTQRTRDTYVSYIDRFILPKWGEARLSDVKTVFVERWLGELEGAPATKSKLRAVLSMIFRHAMRYEFANANPIALVRQSSKRLSEPEILEVSEVRDLLESLKAQPEPSYTLVFLAVVTGLRRGELFGLRWSDVDFAKRQIDVRRSLVNGIVGEPKTSYSRRPIPLSDELADVLLKWRSLTPYGEDEAWVFASPHSFGLQPYWPDSMLYKRIRPAAKAAGITKELGWHSFRRTTASLLLSSGTSIRTTQEIMRHASPTMTLGVYAQSVPAERLAAQQGIATLL